MYEATAKGTADDRRRAQPQITASSPNVATNSLNACAGPERVWREAKNTGTSNMRCAVATPANAPIT
jgi:hypothetical protein